MEYLDYRLFLRDYFEEKLAENRYLVWYLGYHFNIKPDHLRQVIDGVSHLPAESVSKVCTFFRFTRKETGYFKLLFRLNNAEINSDVTRLFRKMVLLRNSSLPIIDRLKYTWSKKNYYKVYATTSWSWESMMAGKCTTQEFRI